MIRFSLNNRLGHCTKYLIQQTQQHENQRIKFFIGNWFY